MSPGQLMALLERLDRIAVAVEYLGEMERRRSDGMSAGDNLRDGGLRSFGPEVSRVLRERDRT